MAAGEISSYHDLHGGCISTSISAFGLKAEFSREEVR
jgi:hypothetical protein